MGQVLPSDSRLKAQSGNNLAKAAVPANELGASYLIEGMAGKFIERRPEGPIVSGVTDIDQVKRIADRLNIFGEKCKENGIGFAYHNHHMEFVQLEDQPAYDIILRNTDPELVKMELTGGLNFDAKVRRESIDTEDIFIGHIGAMDAFTKGLEVAYDLIENSPLITNRQNHYRNFNEGLGSDFENGKQI